jgi:hypothetical protein
MLMSPYAWLVYKQASFFQFCAHPQEVLAKFGYRSDRKVEKKFNLFMATCWNLLLSKYDDDSKQNPSNSGDFGAFFFTKILCMSVTGFLLGYQWLKFTKTNCCL